MSYIILTNIYTLLKIINGAIIITYRIITHLDDMLTHIKVKSITYYNSQI